MRRKIISLFLCIVVMGSIFTGCANDKENKGENTNQSTDENLDEVTDQGADQNGNTNDIEDATISVVYDYEQELNIVDDNYRNYYEIFVGSFYDSDGDGCGDLKGVISKLDYVVDMGFNGIWLMPINESPTYHKYDVMDYYTIDPDYGTMEDLQALIDACHDKEIRLIIDFVFNHTSSKNKWFVEACSYLKTLAPGEEPDLSECPYVDYYHFAYAESGKSGSYYQVGSTNWYYEGVFWSEMPDLNLDSEAVKTEIETIAKYYLDMGMDGFRLDAVIHYEEGNNTKNQEILKWFMDYCRSIKEDVYVVGEGWTDLNTMAGYYSSTINSMFNFALSQYDGKIVKLVNHTAAASSLGDAILKIDDKFSSNYQDYIDAPFITNHDTARLSNTLQNNPDKIKYAAGILMSMNGSPFVYYGEEIGMASSGNKDENKRLAMLWDSEGSEGMTKSPANADAGITSSFDTVAGQLSDPLSIANYYKRAARIRNENPEIARGKVTTYPDISTSDVCVISKEYEGSVVYVIYNMSEEIQTVDLSNVIPEGTTIRGYLTVDGSVIELKDNTVEMPYYSILYLK